MHDFAITEHYAVFVDAPMVLDIMAALHGEPMFRWNPDHVTRVGLLPRDGDAVTWYETEASYINHFWNAWEDGDSVTFAGSRLAGEAYTAGKDGAMDREGADADPGLPTRFTVDTATGSVHVEQFDDLGGDYPRINDAYCGVRSRYHYMGGFRGKADIIGHFDTVVRYDGLTGDRATWWCGPNAVTSEAVFVPDPAGTAEDDGWLLAFVADRTDGSTDVAVLDAATWLQVQSRASTCRDACPSASTSTGSRHRAPPPSPDQTQGPCGLCQKTLLISFRPSDAHATRIQGAESCQKQTRAARPLDGPCSRRRC